MTTSSFLRSFYQKESSWFSRLFPTAQNNTKPPPPGTQKPQRYQHPGLPQLPKTVIVGSMRNARDLEKIHFLTQAEMRRLLKAVGDHKRDRALFLLAYRHGLRASEVGLLQVNDIDFQRNKIRIHRLKGSIGGTHHMQADELKTIKAMIRARKVDSPTLFVTRNSTPVSRRMLDLLMKHYGKRAKLPGPKQHFHALKHTIATHLIDAGADLLFVQDWLGMANLQNVMIYAKLTSGRRDEEARRVAMSSHIV